MAINCKNQSAQNWTNTLMKQLNFNFRVTLFQKLKWYLNFIAYYEYQDKIKNINTNFYYMSIIDHNFLHSKQKMENHLKTLQEKLRQRRLLDNQIENMLIQDTIRKKHLQLQKNRLGIRSNGIATCLNRQNKYTLPTQKVKKVNSPVKINNDRKKFERQKTVENIRNKYMNKEGSHKRNRIQISQFNIQKQPLIQRHSNLCHNFEQLRRREEQAIYYHQMARSMNRLERYLREKQQEEKQYQQLQAKQKQLMCQAFKKRISQLTEKYNKETVKSNQILNNFKQKQQKVNENKILQDIQTTRSPPQNKRFSYLSPIQKIQSNSPFKINEKDATIQNKIFDIQVENERLRIAQVDMDRKIHQKIKQKKQKMFFEHKKIQQEILSQIQRQKQLEKQLERQIQLQKQIQILKYQQLLIKEMKQKQAIKQREQERERFVKQQFQKLKERQKQRQKQNRNRREKQKSIELEMQRQNLKFRQALQQQRRTKQEEWQNLFKKQQQQIRRQFQEQQKKLKQLKQKQANQRQLRDKQIRQILQRQRQQMQHLLQKQKQKEKIEQLYKKNQKERSNSRQQEQQQFQRKDYYSCPKMFTSPYNILNKSMSPTKNNEVSGKFISLNDSSFGQNKRKKQKKSRRSTNNSGRKYKNISGIDSLMPEQAEYVKNIANSRIQKRIRYSKGIFKDSEYRGIKHEIDHLNHTFELQRRARSQVKQRINSNPKVLKKHALVVS